MDFSGLRYGAITLTRITEANTAAVRAMFADLADAPYILGEFDRSYQPRYDAEGRQTKFGFYATLKGELAGLSLLGISSWELRRGYTGADTLLHMRGLGVAPGSKPHLFFLGFHLLDLYRIETGCLASNHASKRSIEKTAGFAYEGRLRGWALNEQGEFEDEYRWAILKPDWEALYDPGDFEIAP